VINTDIETHPGDDGYADDHLMQNLLVLPNGRDCNHEDEMIENDCLGGFDCITYDGVSECFMAAENDCVIGENIHEWQLEEWQYWGFVFDEEGFEAGTFNFAPPK